MDQPFSATWKITDSYVITNGFPTTFGTTTSPLDKSSVTLGNSSSPIDDAYKGQCLRFGELNVARVITKYDGTTKQVFFAPPITDVSIFGKINLKYSILPFSYDNYTYLRYYNTKKEQEYNSSTPSYYKISLLNIVLSNIPLSHGITKINTIAFYPYLHVEIVNMQRGVESLIASNNPYSNRAVFRVPVKDVASPVRSTFIKLFSNMGQIMKINLTDDLFFKVTLMDGTLFKTSTIENFSPSPPNPDIQISCLFQFEKLDGII